MHKTIMRPLLETRTSVVLWANWFQFAAGERVLHPRVLSRMLLWCQEGRGRVRVNGAWNEMATDDFLFLPWAHEVYYIADDREPFKVGAIHIIPDHSLNRKLTFSVSHRRTDRWAKCPWRDDRAWPTLKGVQSGVARAHDPLRLLAAYIVERFEAGALPESVLRKVTQLLVEEIARTLAQEVESHPRDSIVRRVQALIESHGDRQIPLVEMARLAQCSVATLRRHFQKTLGMPPYEWMLQSRIRRARRLLVTTTLRVKEISRRVGFEDPFQFSRAFRQRTGSSPRRFREIHTFAPK